MHKPLISVIIPAYNEEKHIEKSLISIINSSYKNYELIVVCDSCSDKTEEISKKYTENIYSIDHKNVSKTRNYGAHKAKGDILVFFDADTICSENYFLSIVEAMNSGFDYGCSEIVSESGTRKGKFVTKRMNLFNKENKTIGGNCFVKKDHFLKVKGFDNSLVIGEDTDLGNKLRENNAKYIFIKDSHIITSERRFKAYWHVNYFSSSLKNSFLYYISRKKYKKVYSKKVI